MTLAAWLHDWDPFLWRISGDFGLRWYGLSYVAGFVIALMALRFLARRDATLIPAGRATDAILYGALGAFVGGRLGYAVFYQPSLLWSFSADAPFWGMLALGQGGMASHGGMIGVALAAWFVSRGFKGDAGDRVGRAPVLHVFDVFALAAPFGLMLGRMANFVNGELLGRVVAQPGATAPWWAVRFPQELRSGERQGVVLSSDQEAELLGLVDRYRLPSEPIEAGIEGLIAAVQSGSAEAAAAIEPLLSARHPSQLYQAAAEGLIVAAALWLIARKARKPGVIAACFLIVYGLLRIATELVRLPDAHLGVPRPLGLSRGQWLSVAMVVIGGGLLVWRRLVPAEPLGGWARSGGEPVSVR
ncbi:MAG: prolipoprotein diacylglyceryl transferase [Planctomycetota bacterium]